MARFKDSNWSLPQDREGNALDWKSVEIAILMDIRDELKRLNGVLHCPNFLAIPQKLDTIEKNVRKPKKRRKKFVAVTSGR